MNNASRDRGCFVMAIVSDSGGHTWPSLFSLIDLIIGIGFNPNTMQWDAETD